MNDLGRLTSWIGIRENPERLERRGEIVLSEQGNVASSSGERTESEGSQDSIQRLVIQDGITRKSHNVADRSHDCRAKGKVQLLVFHDLDPSPSLTVSSTRLIERKHSIENQDLVVSQRFLSRLVEL